jgi:hypothetical protein
MAAARILAKGAVNDTAFGFGASWGLSFGLSLHLVPASLLIGMIDAWLRHYQQVRRKPEGNVSSNLHADVLIFVKHMKSRALAESGSG